MLMRTSVVGGCLLAWPPDASGPPPGEMRRGRGRGRGGASEGGDQGAGKGSPSK